MNGYSSGQQNTYSSSQNYNYGTNQSGRENVYGLHQQALQQGGDNYFDTVYQYADPEVKNLYGATGKTGREVLYDNEGRFRYEVAGSAFDNYSNQAFNYNKHETSYGQYDNSASIFNQTPDWNQYYGAGALDDNYSQNSSAYQTSWNERTSSYTNSDYQQLGAYYYGGENNSYFRSSNSESINYDSNYVHYDIGRHTVSEYDYYQYDSITDDTRHQTYGSDKAWYQDPSKLYQAETYFDSNTAQSFLDKAYDYGYSLDDIMDHNQGPDVWSYATDFETGNTLLGDAYLSHDATEFEQAYFDVGVDSDPERRQAWLDFDVNDFGKNFTDTETGDSYFFDSFGSRKEGETSYLSIDETGALLTEVSPLTGEDSWVSNALEKLGSNSSDSHYNVTNSYGTYDATVLSDFEVALAGEDANRVVYHADDQAEQSFTQTRAALGITERNLIVSENGQIDFSNPQNATVVEDIRKELNKQFEAHSTTDQAFAEVFTSLTPSEQIEVIQSLETLGNTNKELIQSLPKTAGNWDHIVLAVLHFGAGTTTKLPGLESLTGKLTRALAGSRTHVFQPYVGIKLDSKDIIVGFTTHSHIGMDYLNIFGKPEAFNLAASTGVHGPKIRLTNTLISNKGVQFILKARENGGYGYHGGEWFSEFALRPLNAQLGIGKPLPNSLATAGAPDIQSIASVSGGSDGSLISGGINTAPIVQQYSNAQPVAYAVINQNGEIVPVVPVNDPNRVSVFVGEGANDPNRLSFYVPGTDGAVDPNYITNVQIESPQIFPGTGGAVDTNYITNVQIESPPTDQGFVNIVQIGSTTPSTLDFPVPGSGFATTPAGQIDSDSSNGVLQHVSQGGQFVVAKLGDILARGSQFAPTVPGAWINTGPLGRWVFKSSVEFDYLNSKEFLKGAKHIAKNVAVDEGIYRALPYAVAAASAGIGTFWSSTLSGLSRAQALGVAASAAAGTIWDIRRDNTNGGILLSALDSETGAPIQQGSSLAASIAGGAAAFANLGMGANTALSASVNAAVTGAAVAASSSLFQQAANIAETALTFSLGSGVGEETTYSVDVAFPFRYEINEPNANPFSEEGTISQGIKAGIAGIHLFPINIAKWGGLKDSDPRKILADERVYPYENWTDKSGSELATTYTDWTKLANTKFSEQWNRAVPGQSIGFGNEFFGSYDGGIAIGLNQEQIKHVLGTGYYNSYTQTPYGLMYFDADGNPRAVTISSHSETQAPGTGHQFVFSHTVNADGSSNRKWVEVPELYFDGYLSSNRDGGVESTIFSHQNAVNDNSISWADYLASNQNVYNNIHHQQETLQFNGGNGGYAVPIDRNDIHSLYGDHHGVKGNATGYLFFNSDKKPEASIIYSSNNTLRKGYLYVPAEEGGYFIVEDPNQKVTRPGAHESSLVIYSDKLKYKGVTDSSWRDFYQGRVHNTGEITYPNLNADNSTVLEQIHGTYTGTQTWNLNQNQYDNSNISTENPYGLQTSTQRTKRESTTTDLNNNQYWNNGNEYDDVGSWSKEKFQQELAKELYTVQDDGSYLQAENAYEIAGNYWDDIQNRNKAQQQETYDSLSNYGFDTNKYQGGSVRDNIAALDNFDTSKFNVDRASAFDTSFDYESYLAS